MEDYTNTYDLRKYTNPIVIFNGGSFSPPTIAHCMIAKMVSKFLLSSKRRDIVFYFVPVSDKYNKKSVKSEAICADSNTTRKKMIDICAKYLNFSVNSKHISFRVSPHEMVEDRDVKTFESIDILKTKIRTSSGISYPDDYFAILLGQDNVSDILAGKWSKPFTLLRNTILCIPRAVSDDDLSITPESVMQSFGLLIDTNISKIKEKEQLDENALLGDDEIKRKILKQIIVTRKIPSTFVTLSSTKLRSMLTIYYDIMNNKTELHDVLRKKLIKVSEAMLKHTVKKVLMYILSNNLYRNNCLDTSIIPSVHPQII